MQSNNPSSLAVPRTGKPKPLRPPYYGLKVVPGITFTMGGVLVNGRCEALESETRNLSRACTPPATPSAGSWADIAAATRAA